jgi:hypothetical protein
MGFRPSVEGGLKDLTVATGEWREMAEREGFLESLDPKSQKKRKT